MMMVLDDECCNDSSNEVMTVGIGRWMTLMRRLGSVLVVVVVVSSGGGGGSSGGKIA